MGRIRNIPIFLLEAALAFALAWACRHLLDWLLIATHLEAVRPVAYIVGLVVFVLLAFQIQAIVNRWLAKRGIAV